MNSSKYSIATAVLLVAVMGVSAAPPSGSQGGGKSQPSQPSQPSQSSQSQPKQAPTQIQPSQPSGPQGGGAPSAPQRPRHYQEPQPAPHRPPNYGPMGPGPGVVVMPMQPVPPGPGPIIYRPAPVVSATVVTSQTVVPARVTTETKTVWLTNANGSRNSVLLKAADGGMWVGPKGEYYDSFPTDEQLLPVYGLMTESSAPAAAATVEQPQTVWLTNPNGSRTAVELKPAGGGTWQGPKGEIYDKLPTLEQLQPVYGLQ